MENAEFGVITFKSTHHAIKGESIFKKENIPSRTIPTPRQITHSCGLSIKFSLKDIDRVKRIMEKGGMNVEGVFQLLIDDRGKRFEKLNVRGCNE